MWRPPERLRFPSGPGRVPSREEAARSRLFSPVKVGVAELSQAIYGQAPPATLIAPDVRSFDHGAEISKEVRPAAATAAGGDCVAYRWQSRAESCPRY